jgi:hypothetical protein
MRVALDLRRKEALNFGERAQQRPARFGCIDTQ